jgi:hypothetical protein
VHKKRIKSSAKYTIMLLVVGFKKRELIAANITKVMKYPAMKIVTTSMALPKNNELRPSIKIIIPNINIFC